MSDRSIEAQTEELFQQLLAKAHHILKAGTTQNQIALIRQVIPVLMKEMQAQKAAEERSDERDALNALFAQARETIKPTVAPQLHDLPEDPN